MEDPSGVVLGSLRIFLSVYQEKIFLREILVHLRNSTATFPSGNWRELWFGGFGVNKWRIRVELAWGGWKIFYLVLKRSFLDQLGILKPFEIERIVVW